MDCDKVSQFLTLVMLRVTPQRAVRVLKWSRCREVRVQNVFDIEVKQSVIWVRVRVTVKS